MAESGILSCTDTNDRMSDSAAPKFDTSQAKTWLDTTALFGSIALVVLLFAIPPVLFLVFRDSDQHTWRDVFPTLSQVLDSCWVNQSVRNTVSSSWRTGYCMCQHLFGVLGDRSHGDATHSPPLPIPSPLFPSPIQLQMFVLF